MRGGLRACLLALLGLVAAGCSTTSVQNQLRWHIKEEERLRAQINALEHDLNICRGEQEGLIEQLATLHARLEQSRGLESELRLAVAQAGEVRPAPVAFNDEAERAFEGVEGVTVDRGDAGEIRLTLEQAILFSSGSAAITRDGERTLSRLTSIMKQRFPGREVRVEGHTDDRPVVKSKDRYPSNWELSSARASAVLRALLGSQAVDSHMASVVGHADQRSVAGNDTEAGRKKNRRVEIWILP